MATHRTRDDRQKQLNRSRGMIRYEPGSVRERAREERSALRADGLSSLITRANDVVRPSSEGAQQRRIQKKLRELGPHASPTDYLELLEGEEALMESMREQSATIKLGAIILSSILLILMITYVPGAAASAAAKKASWFGWLTGSSTFTALEELALQFPEGLVEVLQIIRDFSPKLFEAIQSVSIGVAGALNQATLVNVVRMFIQKGGEVYVFNRLYKMVLGKSESKVESESEEMQLIKDVEQKTASELQKNLQRLSDAEGAGAVGILDDFNPYFGGSIRKKKYKKTKKRLSIKNKKRRRNKHTLSKQRRGTSKSSKRRHRKSRRTRK